MKTYLKVLAPPPVRMVHKKKLTSFLIPKMDSCSDLHASKGEFVKENTTNADFTNTSLLIKTTVKH